VKRGLWRGDGSVNITGVVFAEFRVAQPQPELQAWARSCAATPRVAYVEPEMGGPLTVSMLE
jgi:hypothetical protein